MKSAPTIIYAHTEMVCLWVITKMIRGYSTTEWCNTYDALHFLRMNRQELHESSSG